jgi:hypothetical protein
MKNIRLCLFLALILISSNLFSQTILDDAKGGNLLVGFIPGIFKANIADASLSFGYSHNFDESGIDLNIKGKASNGLASIVSIGKIKPEALIEVGYNYHISDLSNTSIIDRISDAFDDSLIVIHSKRNTELTEAKTKTDSTLIEKNYDKHFSKLANEKRHALNRASGFIDDKAGIIFGYQNSGYSFFNSSLTFNDQVSKQQFEAGSVKLYNTSFFRGLDMLSSIILTYKRKNNIDDLIQKTLTITAQTKDSTGNITRTTKQDIPVWVGKYETFSSFDIAIATIIKPWDQTPVGLSGFVRYSSWSDSKNQKFTECGIGIHLLDDEKIFTPKVGLMIQYSSKKVDDSDSELKNQLSLNLTAALPFSFN